MRPPGSDLLTRLPGPGIETLRLLRTFLYRVLSPGAAALDRLARRPPQAPLWLRRHAGPVRASSDAARRVHEIVGQFGLLRDGDLMLDIGCGWGSMAKELGDALGPGGRYLGFDVHAPSITWARECFASDDRFEFVLARIASPFGAKASQRVEDFRFPLPDATAGFVLAKSLFTHLVRTEAQAYLAEIRRVLQPRRSALLTAFLFDPARPTPGFPFPRQPGEMRWRVRARPHAAVAYARSTFEAMIATAGLCIHRFLPGFFPGTVAIPTGQDVLIVQEAQAAAHMAGRSWPAAGRQPHQEG
jgi:ubiquinone/menaquinone biosynthesis C-methylase UbiE